MTIDCASVAPAPIKRHLGKNGPIVNAIGFGAMGLSEFYGAADEAESLAVLNRAIDLGATFIDTADMYGSGANEELLAKVLKTRRSEVFLCTKFGVKRGPGGTFTGVSGSPEYVREAAEASLRRLGVETIDLFYQLRVDPNTPIEDTVRAMAELVEEGKVRYLGLSECSGDTLRKAYAVHPIAAVQIEYSPWTTDIEQNGLLAAARDLGVSIVASSPLGRGFLTGRIRSENFAKNLEIVDNLEDFARRKGVEVSEVVLAWILKQGDEDFIVIPGTKRVQYLEENWGANAVTVTDAEDAEIREIINSITIHGTRYEEWGMKMLNL
ncbi:auxin-induced protein [Blyttiomyces helicus]|uniref:Auxin-induced protein n=1 Tax=Blyttiomyces helicus TaxID=388810 RepID=A0A4P9VVP0_9FUNG|nr:auxin-induced protein [Blyttiomyces helicus]|eukprot:RKO83734.1 auxin-induced protein [Blyttiomyces helicus]